MDCCNQDKISKLIKPHWGEFGKNEIGIKAKSDEIVRQIAEALMFTLARKYKLAFVDHRRIQLSSFYQEIVNVQFAFQGQSTQFNIPNLPNDFQRKSLFNEQDLILINGNHFSAHDSIYVIDNLQETDKHYLPTFYLGEMYKIVEYIENLLTERKPKLNGLVLVGGKSMRMGRDKGLIDYHGKPQREYVHDLLLPYCEEVYFSCRESQDFAEGYKRIEDRLVGLGPVGGILSAMMSNPEKAWLVVACDLPFIDKKTLDFLVQNRNFSKVATAFIDPEGKFPEPLIAIWEPKSYAILYQFLSQGYSCPRKVLINSDTHILKAPNNKALTNANEPNDYEQAKKEINLEN
ncbi:MAG: NTP transferase domain-containing protein [Thermoflexibacter sp.]|jgi:molybdopterin-guanine dinucleotide biosynthesis protein A|nr:NTP transferase domain-containing protein [Thermoflexibacter sp.]